MSDVDYNQAIEGEEEQEGGGVRRGLWNAHGFVQLMKSPYSAGIGIYGTKTL